MKKLGVLLLICSFFTATAHAETKLANGAGTLPAGAGAFSLDLGVSYPTLGYTVGVDFGVTNHLQLGVRGSYGGLWAMGGITTAANFFTSADGADLVGFRMTPSYLWFNAIFSEMKSFWIDPTLVYEHRFGADRDTGVYVKAGTLHIYAHLDSDVLEGFFKSTDANTTTWGHGARTLIGVQHQFGDSFSMTGEGGIGIGFKTSKITPQGQLGFTWAF